jgi:hypothetical protein
MVTQCIVQKQGKHMQHPSGQSLTYPPGMTDDFQLLDRYGFGGMKLNCQRSHWQFCQTNHNAKVDQPLAVAFLPRAWEFVSLHIIEGVENGNLKRNQVIIIDCHH